MMASTEKQDYPPPIVEGALANNTLYPMHALEGTRVFVKFPGMNSAQKIHLRWKGAAGVGSPVFDVLSGSETGIVEFFVRAETIGACIGKTIQVEYVVVEDSETTPSLALELKVQFFEPSALPAADLPDQTENDDGDRVLNLGTFDHDPEVTLPPWPFINAGQRLWMVAIGQRNYPSETELLLLDAYKINEDDVKNGLRLKITGPWIRSLDDYSAMMIRPYVSFDGDPNFNNAHELPHTTCNLRQGKPEKFNDYTDFKYSYWNGWKKGLAAASPLDLVLKNDVTGPYLFNWGYTSPNIGLHLFKDYDYLKPGTQYEFSLELRRNSSANPVPRFSLETNQSIIVQPFDLVSPAWLTVSGTFVANSSDAQLRLVSYVDSVGGNDSDVTRMRLREL
ncbi:hypothetical protein [Pseudomonas sp. stari2]|uniref:hypothetical protein n=1 Tax=Pseudomonas sp. Stari2 TaxID=2954814 RepID=UPI00345D3D3D